MRTVGRFLWRGLRGLLSRVYAVFYRFGEAFEGRFGIYLILLELVLIVTGLIATAADLWHSCKEVWAISDATARVQRIVEICLDHWRDPFEAVAFLLLSFLALSRFLTTVRRHHLGYRYQALEASDELFEKIRQFDWGHAPLVEHPSPQQRRGFANAIAQHSASILSLRSFLSSDRKWLQRERESLDRWLMICPDALWHIPTVEKSAAATDGYVSVLLPVTEDSWMRMRKGMLATDLAEVDRDALNDIARPASDGNVRLLAYLQIHCGSQQNIPLDKELLSAASFQHVAYLLFRLFGADGEFRDRWSFSIMCESANRSMDGFLHGLGFEPVIDRNIEASRASNLPARSYADFRLFEFNISRGNVGGDADRLDGGRFLDLLADLVQGYATNGSRATATLAEAPKELA